MREIVSSVRRVTDLIGEISASATEQRDGFAQVNQAVSNLDQMTQQNAALVEESSAAATSMNEQAQRLAQVVSVFNVGSSMAVAAPVQRPAAVRNAATPSAAPAPVRKVAAASAKASHAPAAKPVESAPKLLRPAPVTSNKPTSGDDDDWETF